MKNSKKGIVYGILAGFIVSVTLWVTVGINYVKMK
jgi:hypothetical protein